MGGGDRLIISIAPTPATIMLPPNRPGTHQPLVCFVEALSVVSGVAVGVGFGCACDGRAKLNKLTISRAGRQGTNI